ncbi:MAG: response regulator [Rubrobacteraceae bacterium]
MVKRVLLVDDHAIFTQAMKLVIRRVDGMEVAGIAGTLAEGRKIVFADEVEDLDLVLVDLRLPDGHGAKLVAEIKARRPEVLVVVLSAEDDLSDALQAGADEAMNKSTPLPEIVATLRRIVG